MCYSDLDERKLVDRVKEWFPLKNGNLIVKLKTMKVLTIMIKQNQ